MSGPGHLNVFQWKWECFFLRHIELYSWFKKMTINGISLNRPEVFSSFRVIFCFFRLKLFLWPWDSPLRFCLLTVCSRLRVPGICSLFLTILLYHLPQEIRILLLSELSKLLLHLIFRDRFLMHPFFDVGYEFMSFPNSPRDQCTSITSFLLLTFVRFHAENFYNFSHSLSTAAFAAGIESS